MYIEEVVEVLNNNPHEIHYIKRKCWGQSLCIELQVDPYYQYHKSLLGRYIEDGEIGGGHKAVFKSLQILRKNLSDWEFCDINGRTGRDVINNIINKREKEMKNVNYIGGAYKLVKANYDLVNGTITPTRDYVFKADIDLEIKADDLAVVEASNGYGIARVTDVLEDNLENAHISEQATAWVVDVVDQERHNKKKEATEKMAFIERKLKEREKQMSTLERFSLMAKFDLETAKLVEEMQNIMGVKSIASESNQAKESPDLESDKQE